MVRSVFRSDRRPVYGLGRMTRLIACVALSLVMLHCGRDGETEPPDVLLITIDTLRADVLEPYGAVDTLTPSIAGLAEQGVVYEAATSPIPLTRPAHASILTGLYPDQHGVLTNHQILPGDVVTLAELLRDSGYLTAAFTAVRFVNEKSGLAQGFDEFDAPTRVKTPRAKEVVERAVSWLGGSDREKPILLWVHVYDPHQPYNPVRKFRRNIDPDLENRVPIVRWKALNRVAREHNRDIPADVFGLALDYYRFEVEYADFWVGRLLASFDRIRASRRSLVVLTADHGECFENGNFFEHADCLNEGALRVPLIVRYPDGVGSGNRVGRRVSNLDIMPTVLHELSLPSPEGVAGLPLQEDFGDGGQRYVLVRPPEVRNPDRIPHRLRIIQTVVGEPVLPATDPRTRGIVDLQWKFLRAPGSDRLWRLPDERSNLASDHTEVFLRMLEALESETARHPSGAAAAEDLDPETIEALEALGYVQ